jgi:hypothetical protein
MHTGRRRDHITQAERARCYGRDVAEFLSEGPVALGIGADYLDEDWGWLILSTHATVPAFEVARYSLSEHSEGGRPAVNASTWNHGEMARTMTPDS